MPDQTVDYAALASQYGGVASDDAPAAPASGSVDYNALLKQFGGTAADEQPEAPTRDYAVLLKKFGGTAVEGPQPVPGMEKLGGTPPGAPQAPLPKGILNGPPARPWTDEEASQLNFQALRDAQARGEFDFPKRPTFIDPSELGQGRNLLKEPMIPAAEMLPQPAEGESPFLTGSRAFLKTAEQITTPESALIIGATGGLGELGAVGRALQTGAGLYFGGKAVKGTYDAGVSGYGKLQNGDVNGAAADWGMGTADGLFAALIGRAMFRGLSTEPVKALWETWRKGGGGEPPPPGGPSGPASDAGGNPPGAPSTPPGSGGGPGGGGPGGGGPGGGGSVPDSGGPGGGPTTQTQGGGSGTLTAVKEPVFPPGTRFVVGPDGPVPVPPADAPAPAQAQEDVPAVPGQLHPKKAEALLDSIVDSLQFDYQVRNRVVLNSGRTTGTFNEATMREALGLKPDADLQPWVDEGVIAPDAEQPELFRLNSRIADLPLGPSRGIKPLPLDSSPVRPPILPESTHQAIRQSLGLAPDEDLIKLAALRRMPQVERPGPVRPGERFQVGPEGIPSSQDQTADMFGLQPETPGGRVTADQIHDHLFSETEPPDQGTAPDYQTPVGTLHTADGKPVPITVDGKKAFLTPPVPTESGKTYHSVVDADGKLLVGGTAETVRNWLNIRHAEFPLHAGEVPLRTEDLQPAGHVLVSPGKAEYASPKATGPRSPVSNDTGDTSAETPHKFSSTQFNLPDEVAKPLQRFGRSIPAEELAPEEGAKTGGSSSANGLETESHVTLKYGNPSADPGPIAAALQDQGPITVTLGKARVFKGKDGKPDVLVVDVESDELHDLNKTVGDAVEHTGNTFPTYKPHVTIAYLKPGEGDKYDDGQDIPGVTGKQIRLDTVQFSGKDGQKTDIQLTGGEQDEGKLYNQIAEHVRGLDKVSTSILQRQFRLGYGRATQMLDTLQTRGVVGPPDERGIRPVLKEGERPAPIPQSDQPTPAMQAIAQKIRDHDSGAAPLSPEDLKATIESGYQLRKTLGPAYVEGKRTPNEEAFQSSIGDALRAHADKGIASLKKPPITDQTPLWEMSPPQFLEHRREQALRLPKLPFSDVVQHPEKWSLPKLMAMSGKDLKAVLTLHGLPVNGTKSQQAQRLLDARATRNRFAGKSADQIASELTGKQIDDVLRQLGAPLIGNKETKARTILGTIDSQRRGGESALAAYNFQRSLQQAANAGQPVPAEVMERYGITPPAEKPQAESSETQTKAEEEKPDVAYKPQTAGPAPARVTARTRLSKAEWRKLLEDSIAALRHLQPTVNGEHNELFGTHYANMERAASEVDFKVWSKLQRRFGQEGKEEATTATTPHVVAEYAKAFGIEPDQKEEEPPKKAEESKEKPPAKEETPPADDFSTARIYASDLKVGDELDTAPSNIHGIEIASDRWVVTALEQKKGKTLIYGKYPDQMQALPTRLGTDFITGYRKVDRSDEEKPAAPAKKPTPAAATPNQPERILAISKLFHDITKIESLAAKAGRRKPSPDLADRWAKAVKIAKELGLTPPVPPPNANGEQYGLVAGELRKRLYDLTERLSQVDAGEPAKKEKAEKPAATAPEPPPDGTWMNQGEIERAVEKYKNHPVLSRATRFLQDLYDETNDHSDGWPYWKQPSQAASQLMGLIQHPEYASEENFQRALRPIKSFYTRRGEAAGMRFPDIVDAGEPAKKEKAEKPAATAPVTVESWLDALRASTEASPGKKAKEAKEKYQRLGSELLESMFDGVEFPPPPADVEIIDESYFAPDSDLDEEGQAQSMYTEVRAENANRWGNILMHRAALSVPNLPEKLRRTLEDGLATLEASYENYFEETANAFGEPVMQRIRQEIESAVKLPGAEPAAKKEETDTAPEEETAKAEEPAAAPAKPKSDLYSDSVREEAAKAAHSAGQMRTIGNKDLAKRGMEVAHVLNAIADGADAGTLPAAIDKPVVLGTRRQIGWILHNEKPPEPATGTAIGTPHTKQATIYQDIGTAGLLDPEKYTAARQALLEMAKGYEGSELSDQQPAPPAVSFPKEGTVVIIPCAKSKVELGIGEHKPAEDVYTGDYFKSNLAYARAHGAKVFILSAKYGLIEPDQPITDYDVSFITSPGKSVKAEKLAEQIAEHGLDKMDRWVVLGGKEYTGRIREAQVVMRHNRGEDNVLDDEELSKLPEIITPTAGMAIGQAKQHVKQATPPAEAANRDRKEKIRKLQQEISGLQKELAGKRDPHGEVVTDAKGYAIRTKWPSNFNKADKALHRKFSRLTDAKRELSALSRETPPTPAAAPTAVVLPPAGGAVDDRRVQPKAHEYADLLSTFRGLSGSWIDGKTKPEGRVAAFATMHTPEGDPVAEVEVKGTNAAPVITVQLDPAFAGKSGLEDWIRWLVERSLADKPTNLADLRKWAKAASDDAYKLRNRANRANISNEEKAAAASEATDKENRAKELEKDIAQLEAGPPARKHESTKRVDAQPASGVDEPASGVEQPVDPRQAKIDYNRRSAAEGIAAAKALDPRDAVNRKNRDAMLHQAQKLLEEATKLQAQWPYLQHADAELRDMLEHPGLLQLKDLQEIRAELEQRHPGEPQPELTAKEKVEAGKSTAPAQLPPAAAKALKHPEPETKRTTPAPGTKEREALEKAYADASQMLEANGDERRTLEHQLNRMRGGVSKKRTDLRAKLDKLENLKAKLADVRESLRPQVHRASLEDAAFQTEDPLLAAAAQYRIDLADAGSDRSREDWEKRRDTLEKQFEEALSKKVPALDAAATDESTRKEIAALTPEENAAAVKAAVTEVANRLIEYPLTAKSLDKDLAGALHGNRVKEYKKRANAELDQEQKRYADATGVISSGDTRVVRDARRDVNGAYEIGPIDTAVARAREAIDQEVSDRAAKAKEAKQAAIELAEKVRPLSEVATPAMNHKLASGKVWDGNVVTSGDLLSDGHSAIDADALDRKRAASVRARMDDVRQVPPEAVRKVWDQAVAESTKPLTELGHVQAEEHGDDLALFTGPDDTVHALAAKRLRWLQSITGADELRGGDPKKAVVLYKGGKPVAVLMPMKPTAAIDVPTARKAVAAIAPAAAAPEAAEPSADRYAEILKELKTLTGPDPLGEKHNRRVELEAEAKIHQPAAEARAQQEINTDKRRRLKEDLAENRKLLAHGRNPVTGRPWEPTQLGGLKQAIADQEKELAALEAPTIQGTPPTETPQETPDAAETVPRADQETEPELPRKEDRAEPGEQPAEDVRGPGQTRPAGGHRAPDVEGVHGRPVRSGRPQKSPVQPGEGNAGQPDLAPERKGSAKTRRKPGQRGPDFTADYRITEGDHIGEGSALAKAKANVEAIRILKAVEQAGRAATPEEQAALAKYTGWGSTEAARVFDVPYTIPNNLKPLRTELDSLLTPAELKAVRATTVNAHYTSPLVVGAMWDAIRRLGMEPGDRVLEPSLGVGNFFGLMPEDLRGGARTGVEIDPITGGIAKLLYPGSNVQITPFEKSTLPNNYFDVAIGNVPFGNYGVSDPEFLGRRALTKSIHNYFFAKALDKVRPGGVVAFVTSSFTMDSANSSVRDYLAQNADLLGAIRLPETAFKSNAGTSVTTDIIFLRKKDPASPLPTAAPAWSQLKTIKALTSRPDGSRGEADIEVNEYYAAHPEMMLGKMSIAGGRFRDAHILEGTLTPESIAKAIENLPKGALQPIVESEPAPARIPLSDLPDATTVKDGGYVFKDGELLVRDGNELKAAGLDDVKTRRVRGMLGVRDAWRNVLRAQEGTDEAAAKKARKLLNDIYDTFTRTNGPLSSRSNMQAFAGDPDAMPLVSLEDYNPETKTAKKADIFRQSTNVRYVPPDTAENAAAALAIALNEYGGINWPRIQQLTGLDREAAQKELSESGLVYRNPEGDHFETADQYLSGNVRAKLQIAIEAAKADTDLTRNVEALEKVQPEDLGPGEIDARLGAGWIPADVVSQFIEDNLKVRGVKVGHAEALASWSLAGGADAYNPINQTEYGGDGWSGVDLVEQAMNLKSPTVRIKTKDSSVVDPVATAALREKQQKLRDLFRKWVWEDAARATRLAGIYNQHYNNLRLREFDGSHLQFPGMAAGITLRPHQKNAIWRMLQGGNTLLAHVVGAGKTFAIIAAAMEMRRLGTAKKPMIVVPKNLVPQWQSDFQQLYPGAKLFVADEETFSAANRQKAMARIANNEYDAVIVAHTSFGLLPVKDETFMAWLDEQIQDLEDAIREASAAAGEKSKTVKELEKAKKRLEAKLERRAKREKKDNAIHFEDLGVDQLFVDEAHAFKNLFFTTKMTRIAGIPNTESDRAIDMFLKTQWLTKKRGGSGVTFATGTPISNTMAEMYTVMRYLQNDHLRKTGLGHFDAWAQMYGEGVTSLELAPDGSGYRMNTRFSRFTNLPELATAFRISADVQTAEMLKLPTPALKGGKPIIVAAKPSQDLKDYVQHLVERAEAMRRTKVDPKKDNMLKITGEGRKAALDMRLVPQIEIEDKETHERRTTGYHDNPGSKVNLAVDHVFRIWKETAAQRSTQLVFSDLSTPHAEGGFSVYTDVRDKLIKRGIPAEEIAFIHDYDTAAQKRKLFRAVREGKIRVLMGSTEKMGAGMNVQTKLIALHHLDAPWRPSDIEQREGRILRQGNENKEVEIYRYVTEGSFDAYMWQILEAKARFISQVMRGNSSVRSAEDVEGGALTYAEIKGIASGNPRVVEKIKIDMEVRRLDTLRAAYDNQLYSLRRDAATTPQVQKYQTERLEKLEEDIERRDQADKLWHLGGKAIESNLDAGARLHEMLEADRDKLNAARADLDATFLPRYEDLTARLAAASEAAAAEGDDYVHGSKAALSRLQDEKAAFGKEYAAAVEAMRENWKPVKLGKYRGFDLITSEAQRSSYYDNGVTTYGLASIRVHGANDYSASAKETPAGTLASIRYHIDGLDEDRNIAKTALAVSVKRLQTLKDLLSKPFEHAGRLADLLKEQTKINAELDLNKNDTQTQGIEQKEQEVEKAQEPDEEEETGPAFLDPAAPEEDRREAMRRADERIHNMIREEQHKPEPDQAKIARLQAMRLKSGATRWTPEPEDGGPLFNRAMPGMYSQLERTVEKKMKGPAQPAQLLAMLRKPENGVKPDELRWTGLDAFLEGRAAPVTKQQVLDYVKANEVHVEEVMKGGDPSVEEEHARLVRRNRELEEEYEELNRATPDYNADEDDEERDMPTDAEIASAVGWLPEQEDRFEEIARERAVIRRRLAELDRAIPQPTLNWRRELPGWRGEDETDERIWVADAPGGGLYEIVGDYDQGFNVVGSNHVYRTVDEAKEHAQTEADEYDESHPPAGATKYGKYVTPGGENYRELLLTLPEKPSGFDPSKVEIKRHRPSVTQGETSIWYDGKKIIAYSDDPSLDPDGEYRQRPDKHWMEVARDLYEKGDRINKIPQKGQSYRSSHWEEPNVLVHIRFAEHDGPAGTRVLHIEEWQSDWHQQGKKKGYQRKPTFEEFRAHRAATLSDQAARATYDDIYGPAPSMRDTANYPGISESGVPAAPFAKTWHELAFRRMLRYAAEHGFDAMTWSTGAQQNERYDLSKHVNQIRYIAKEDGTYDVWAADEDGRALADNLDWQRLKPEQIEEYVGKDVAQRILDGKGQQAPGEEPGEMMLSGVDLQIGGEGMKGFYDKIVPAYAAKYAKKWGAHVGEMQIDTGGELRIQRRTIAEILREDFGLSNWSDATEEQKREAWRRKEASEDKPQPEPPITVHSIEINAALRDSVMEGQPLFVRGSQPHPSPWGDIHVIQHDNTVLTNPAGMKALAEAFGESGRIAGATLEPRHVEQAVAYLRAAAPALTDAIEQAYSAASNGLVLVASSRPLSEAKTSLRHERFHEAQAAMGPTLGHLGKHRDALLNHKLGRIARIFLRLEGYKPKQMALEIGAHLAAGQYQKLGLTRDQAKVLFFHYIGLLKLEYGEKALQALERVAPMMRGAIHAARRRSARRRDTQEQSKPGAPSPRKGPGGVQQGLRPAVPGEEDDEEPDFARGPAVRANRAAGAVLHQAVQVGAPLLEAAVDAWDSARSDLQKTFNPVALPAGRPAGLSLREHAAQAAQTFARAEEALHEARKYFAREHWDDNLDFINRVEDGARQSNAQRQKIADTMRELLDAHRLAVQQLGPGKLTSFYENYFPHLWKRGKEAESIFRAIFGKRPIEGTKAFLKKRKFHSFQEGVDAGLVPVSENPVDLVMLKLKEMERYILAHRFLKEMKEIGLAKYVPSQGKKRVPPQGWVKIPDQIGTVWAPPFVRIQEAHDRQFIDTLLDLAGGLGMDVQRVAKLRGAWGRSDRLNNIVKTRFAGPESVILHEIAHLLDWKYDIGGQLLHDPEYKQELQKLADMRVAKGDTPYFAQYVRRGEEKIANMIAAYGHAPARMKKAAPKTYRWLRNFISQHPELAPLSKLSYGLQLAVRSIDYPVGGFVQTGSYFMPSGAAQVVSNFLSPGLGGKPWYQVLRSSSNMMLQFSLGFSGFHLGFVTYDAMVSKLALAMQYAADGKPVTALNHALRVPAAPVTNFIRGGRIRKAYLDAAINDPELAKYVEALVQGGGRVTMDEQYRTNMRDRFLDAWRKQAVGTAALAALPAIAETVMWPVMELVVPRMKIGMYADMVNFELQRLGPNATRDDIRKAFAGAWDSVDNRMGQLVYDNRFWNRTAKDLMMISVQSLGWNWGTFDELGGAGFDTAHAAKQIGGRIIRRGGGGPGGRGPGGRGPGGPGGTGGGGGTGGTGGGTPPQGPGVPADPLFTRRMAYSLALVMLTGTLGAITDYVNTVGRRKADGSIDDGHERGWRNEFFPRTGGLDEQGHDARIALPGYLKDVVAWGMEPANSARNKLSPIARVVAETLANRNFYTERIAKPSATWTEVLQNLPPNVLSELKHIAAFFMPMSVSGFLRERARGASTAMQLGQFIGLRTAPSYITRTPAERYMSGIDAANGHEATPTSKSEREITQALRARDFDKAIELSEKASKAGLINDKQLNLAIKNSQTDPLVAQFNRLQFSQALQALKLMTPSERQRTSKVFDAKLKRQWDQATPAGKQRLMEEMTRAGMLQ